MLAVAALITIGTGIAFGVMPALRMSRRVDASALKEGARGGTSRGTERLRSSLVVAEIVASVVLLVSAGLLIQALLQGAGDRSGLPQRERPDAEDDAAAPEVSATARREQFYRQVIGETRALPGVRARRLHQLHAVHDARRHVGDPDDHARSDEPRRLRRAAGCAPSRAAIRHAGVLRDDRHSDPARPRRR